MASHENLKVFKKTKVGSNKKFCLTFAGVFIFFAIYPMVYHMPLRIWSLALSAICFLLAFTKPDIVKPLNIAWGKVGLILGKIMTPVIMGALFFTIFLFTGLMLRLFRKDLLSLKRDPSQESYWIKKDNVSLKKKTFEEQF